MNKKGFELAISTLILIIIGLALLVGIIFAVKGGFSNLNKSTEPLYDSTQGAAIKQSCDIACTAEDLITYCCKIFDLGNIKIGCTDPNLGVSCGLSCAAVSCPAS